ncbi:hypothetical protein [Streptomyces sp. NBC_00370]|uniref:hypothetical protein n=1 Tax=Streptomyces sp. NBC_00370 TaxID=2975728 RepID=UPI002E266EA4
MSKERDSFVVALMVAALAALLLGACDSGGHHRLVGMTIDQQAVTALVAAPATPQQREPGAQFTSETTVGCQGGDRDHCVPVSEQHVATQGQGQGKRHPHELPAALIDASAATAPSATCSAVRRRGPPGVPARDVLNRLCVSRR